MNCNLSGSKLTRIFGISLLSLSGVCALLYTLSIFFFYDADIGYFSKGAPLPVILYVLTVLVSVAAALGCLISKIPIEPQHYGDCKIANYLYAVPIAATVYFMLARAPEFAESFRSVSEYFRYLSSGIKLEFTLITPMLTKCAAYILAIPALVYFVLAVFREKINRPFVSVFGIFAALWLLPLLSDTYFNMLVAMNSPHKTFAALALISGALFLIAEIRLVLPYKKPRLHLFASAFAVLLLSVSSIPTVIAHFCGAFKGSYSMGVDTLICLALLFPACARFISFCFSKSPEELPDDTSATEQDNTKTPE